MDPFRTALMAYLLGGGAEYFRDSMEELRENYPAPAFYGAMNFLSTHDMFARNNATAITHMVILCIA